ncbi:hypothetical protein B0I35DRAFT_76575 [Stachybotrys elegans]|uniref:Uncharacterized protein n=1 Tax=Stachybotrys elegans TaxID=80388 RepID=A0A8K0WNJ0_9HYPO|nr:hypothetical protein B0I35DRAFT_76575 [Stachybotrys elegans]
MSANSTSITSPLHLHLHSHITANVKQNFHPPTHRYPLSPYENDKKTLKMPTQAELEQQRCPDPQGQADPPVHEAPVTHTAAASDAAAQNDALPPVEQFAQLVDTPLELLVAALNRAIESNVLEVTPAVVQLSRSLAELVQSAQAEPAAAQETQEALTTDVVNEERLESVDAVDPALIPIPLRRLWCLSDTDYDSDAPWSDSDYKLSSPSSSGNGQ